MLRRHPVVLKETKNRADTKMSVTVESEFILSLKGKFHSNAPSSFWGDAITRKIKDGRRGHVFWQIGFYFGTCSTTHWGEHFDQICRRTGIFSVLAQPGIEVNTIGMFHLNPSFSFWGDVITRKINDGRRRPCLSTDRNYFWNLHN